jgi:hypothetical protein
MDDVHIKTLYMGDIGKGRNYLHQEQLDEFAASQDSQGMRMACLAESVKMAYNRSNKN